MRQPINLAAYPATLNVALLTTLPVVTMKAGWHLGSPGMGCFGEPPGHPTYYMQPIYNGRGDQPRNAPDAVLPDPNGVLHSVGSRPSAAFYVPLPVDHPRVLAWIDNVMSHMHHCYADAERPEYGRPGTLIFPVPGYKLRTWRDDHRWNDEYRAASKAEVDAFNRFEVDRATAIATVDNHQGVRRIRAVYPSWTPPIHPDQYPNTVSGWWTTEETPPAPGQCPGDRSVNLEHKDTHCQWCGARS